MYKYAQAITVRATISRPRADHIRPYYLVTQKTLHSYDTPHPSAIAATFPSRGRLLLEERLRR